MVRKIFMGNKFLKIKNDRKSVKSSVRLSAANRKTHAPLIREISGNEMIWPAMLSFELVFNP